MIGTFVAKNIKVCLPGHITKWNKYVYSFIPKKLNTRIELIEKQQNKKQKHNTFPKSRKSKQHDFVWPTDTSKSFQRQQNILELLRSIWVASDHSIDSHWTQHRLHPSDRAGFRKPGNLRGTAVDGHPGRNWCCHGCSVWSSIVSGGTGSLVRTCSTGIFSDAGRFRCGDENWGFLPGQGSSQLISKWGCR